MLKIFKRNKFTSLVRTFCSYKEYDNVFEEIEEMNNLDHGLSEGLLSYYSLILVIQCL